MSVKVSRCTWKLPAELTSVNLELLRKSSKEPLEESTPLLVHRLGLAFAPARSLRRGRRMCCSASRALIGPGVGARATLLYALKENRQ